MQRNKGIQNISEIGDLSSDRFHLLDALRRVTDRFNMSSITRQFNVLKARGINANELFRVLFMFPFLSINNIHCLFASGLRGEIVGYKDTYYRFLNNPNISWRKILTSFNVQFLKQARLYGDINSSGAKCLIVDDSLIPKTGKKIEFIGKVFDHSTHKYLLGFKLLLLGYWDGKSFLPMDFSLHYEPGKKKTRGLKQKDLDVQYTKQRAENCMSNQRISELGKSKIEVALQMIKREIKNKLRVDYVLTDSWFVSEGFIANVLSMNLDVIGLMKSNRCIQIGSKTYKLNKLPDLKRDKTVNCKMFKCQYIPLTVSYKGIDLKIFLVRMNGQSNWKVLITTDLKLSFVKTMKLYQIRWTIEVFFKDAKQHLNLSGCQSNDYDAHIAHYSLVCMAFTALSLIKRVENYETIGSLLIKLKDNIIQHTVVHKISRLIFELYNDFLADLGIEWNSFIRKIINDEEWKDKIYRFSEFLLKAHNSPNNLAL